MISIIQYPQILHPVNSVNGIPFIVSSTLTSDTNFHFVFDLYVQSPSLGTTGGTFTKIHRAKTVPSPVDSYGHYSPAELLKNYISYDVYPYITSPTANTNSIRWYNIIYGEYFSTNQSFSATSNNGGFLRITFPSLSGVSVNDEVQIVMDSGTENSQYSGVWTATGVSSTILDLNCPYGNTPTTTESGYLKTITHLQANLSGYAAYNGTKQYIDQGTNFSNRFKMTGTSSQWLTNYNYTTQPYRIGNDEAATLSFFQYNNSISHYRVLTYSGATNIGDFLIVINSSFSIRKDIPSGSWNLRQITNLNDISGLVENVFVDGITSYSIQLYNGLTPVSKIVNYEVICTNSRFGNIRFCFVNKNGGIDYYSFNMKSILSNKMKREVIDKTILDTYLIGDRGETVIGIDTDSFLEVNSNWVKDNESVLIREMINSPEIYFMSTGEMLLYPVTITNVDFTQKNKINNNLFNYTLKMKYSYPNINQGN